MLIPPQNIQSQLKAEAEAGGPVRLKGSHLLIDAALAEELFGDAPNVHLIYYPDRRSLLMAPESDELFKKLHKAKPYMLKNRTAKGDKTIGIRELLIDHDINDTDRDLQHEGQKALRVLNVKL